MASSLDADVDQIVNEWHRETSTGGVILTMASFVPGQGTRRKLSIASRFALAATSACCAKGFGKVYITCPHPDPGNQTMRGQIDRYHRLRSETELLWAPYGWTAEDREHWLTMSGRQKLCSLSALDGAIADIIPVIPFCLEYSERVRELPRLTGFTTQLVTVLLSPEPYVGSTVQMRSVCTAGYGESEAKNDPSQQGNLNDYTFTALDGWSAFEPWKAGFGMNGVLECLEGMWRGEDQNLDFVGTRTFGAIRRAHLRITHMSGSTP